VTDHSARSSEFGLCGWSGQRYAKTEFRRPGTLAVGKTRVSDRLAETEDAGILIPGEYQLAGSQSPNGCDQWVRGGHRRKSRAYLDPLETGKQLLAQAGELPLAFFGASLLRQLALLVQHTEAQNHEDQAGSQDRHEEQQ
jgi:hypothetical protein